MDFRVLGPLEIIGEGAPIRLGGLREQAVMAMFLLQPDTIIPVERLVDAVWGDRPPATARAQIQICVSALRRLLGDPERIRTRNPGYLFRLGTDVLDARVFEQAASDGHALLGRGRVAEAAAEFRRALSLWRGPALANVVGDVVQHSVAHLNERRLNVLEVCLEAELEAGTRGDLVGELVRVCHEYPLNERFRLLLMTALYRAGRQAEALEVYRATRGTLKEELGIEPGPELRRLHQAILTGEVDERTAAATPAPETGSGIAAVVPPPETPSATPTPATPMAPTIPGISQPSTSATAAASSPAVARRAGVRPPPTPRLLPPAIPDFTGRAKAIARIVSEMPVVRTVDDGPAVLPVTVLYGQGGVGKTTLAVHVAHRLAEAYPDGQLYARLRDGDQPVAPADVLERFLRALGVAGPLLAEGLEERAEMYRDLLGDRRVLVVLDDAMTEHQVQPLLPGGPGCSVIVTSRRRLTGVPAAVRLEVGTFSDDSAVALLSRVADAARIRAEPEAVAQLCRLCGHLPLALRIVAARLAARPHWSVRALVDRLIDESRQLDELNHEGVGMRASISVTYAGLSAEARQLFRRLALFGGPDFAAWVAAPLLEADVFHAENLLEELTEAYLIDIEQGPDGAPTRYRFHDIVRPFARERLLAEDPPAERHQALERLIGAHLFLAKLAHEREYSGDHLLPADGATTWPLPRDAVDPLIEDPLTWFERERLSLVAAVRQAAARGLADKAWSLAMSSVALFEARSYYGDWRETHETALEAVCQAGDRRGEAAMRYSLGSLHMFEQDNAGARAQFDRASAIYRELDDRYGAALVLRNVAVLDRREGHLDRALDRWTDALATFREVGDRVAEAYVLNSIAQVHLARGHDGAAFDLLTRAELICAETGVRRVAAQVQLRLGDMYRHRNDMDRARAAYRQVLAAVRETGDRIGECHALMGLGATEAEDGHPGPAVEALRHALEAAEAVGDRILGGRAALTLARAELAAGNLAEAADDADHAVRALGDGLASAQALVLRGRIRDERGDTSGAVGDWWQAATVATAMTVSEARDLAGEIAALLAEVGGGESGLGS
ncbi:DNA-binding SARP family transcriptional activator/predicted negative regulator of RcsB-dependent stress response [Catenulispora sp. GP43]|uniref:AfsR/SARP family transcriptional regulator n=1 Tax=Catenulispora sp. GP43 TaxID=3156263 RepID=UPI0035127066